MVPQGDWLQNRRAQDDTYLEAVTKLVAVGLVPARAGHKGLGYYRPWRSCKTETSMGFVITSQAEGG